MLVTPYDMMNNQPILQKDINTPEQHKVYNEYSTKFKSAIYAAILFILLSKFLSFFK